MKNFPLYKRKKTLRIKILVFLVLFVFIYGLYAQGNVVPNSKRVVIINKYAFEDSQTGILKLIKANEYIERGDCFDAPSICAQDRKRQSKIIIEPIENEISDLLKKIEIENNFIILDGVKLEENEQLLAFDEKLDISKQFISYFNNKSKAFDKFISPDFSQNKVAVINSKVFFDRTNGLNLFIKSLKIEPTNNYCADAKICLKISKAINTFAKTNGYSFILDSSKNLPDEINKLQKKDVTQEFISEFNKNN